MWNSYDRGTEALVAHLVIGQHSYRELSTIFIIPVAYGRQAQEAVQKAIRSKRTKLESIM